MKRTLAALAAIAVAALAAAAAAAPSTLTLAAAPTVVVYGQTTTLSGQLTPAQANQNITIQAQTCGSTNFKKATTVKTNSTGAYTATVTPTAQTTYKATEHGETSNLVVVKVRPAVKLTRVASRSFSVGITAGQSLVGKSIVFQRYARLRHRWVRVKNVTLTTATPGSPRPTVVTSAAFRARVARRARVRAVLTLAQAQPCYVSAKSNVVRA
jgi:hypothetical protein